MAKRLNNSSGYICVITELGYSVDIIKLNDKELTELDNFVKKFVKIFDNYFKYVIVIGYVAILFGRNRSSEDIDVFIEKKDFDAFKKFWDEVKRNYDCININDSKEACEVYLSDNIPLLFLRKNEFIPNVELKFPKSKLDDWTLSKRKKVLINEFCYMFFF